MKTANIKIPPGHKIKNVDIATGAVTFEELPKDMTSKIQTFADVLKINDTDADAFGKSLQGLSQDEVAYRQIKEIVKAYNQGWTPNWADSSEIKYVPWFDMQPSSGSGFAYYDFDSWAAYTLVGSRLCFQKSAYAKDAGTKFISIYKDFFIINK